MATAVLLALVAGTIAAQAPDIEEEAGAPQRQRVVRQAVMGTGGLLAPANAKVTPANVVGGVELLITTDDPEDVEALREQVNRDAENWRTLGERIGRFRERFPNYGANSVYGVLDKVTITVAEIDAGSVVRLLAEDEETVKELQNNMPGWIKQAEEQRDRMAQYYRQATAMAELRRMIQAGEVKLVTEKTEEGLTVRFTAEDPEAVAKLQETLPVYFEQLLKQGNPWQRRRDDGDGPDEQE